MQALGRHILVEFLNCSSAVLNDVAVIENAMVKAAEAAGATVIQSSFHHFSPWGVSGVVVIQESHLAIHTWPEYEYAAVDLFTCGDTVDPWISFDHLKKAFQSSTQSAVEMYRGSSNLIKRVDFGGHAKPMHEKIPVRQKVQRSFWFTDKDENQAFSLRHTGEVLFQETSQFQKVRVLQSLSHGRMMTINDMVMCTERDEAHYHEMIVHPALQLHPRPQNVLVIGGGDGGSIREIFRYPSLATVTMVEIDETVVRASQQHLPSLASEFNNPKLKLIIADGIDFVERAAARGEEQYDLIVIDGSDPVGPAAGLFSEKFYRNCHRLLRQGGLLTLQGESPMFHQNAFVELRQVLSRIFLPDQVHTALFFAPSYPTGMWSIHMASKNGPHPIRDFNSARTKDFVREHRLKYYNEQIHTGAFCLPGFVQKMLEVEPQP